MKKKGVDSRALMLFFAGLVTFGLFMKINYLYDAAENIYYYVFVTGFLLTFTLSAEVSFTAMFGTITPDHIVQSFWNAGNE